MRGAQSGGGDGDGFIEFVQAFFGPACDGGNGFAEQEVNASVAEGILELEKGMASERAAFEVGVAFETLDIKELEAALEVPGLHAAEKEVLERLRTTSYRHLSAFQRQLNR